MYTDPHLHASQYILCLGNKGEVFALDYETCVC